MNLEKKLKSDAEADLEGGALEGDGADSGRGLEMADCEYDSGVGGDSSHGIVLDEGPLPGGVFPEGALPTVTRSGVETENA